MFGRRSIRLISAALAVGFSPWPEPFPPAALASGREPRPSAALARYSAPEAHPSSGARFSKQPATGGLPDSVLVRIEGGRDIVRSFALRRWREQHEAASVESITPAALHGFLDLLIDEAVLTEAAAREGAAWSPADSSDHRALWDRLALAAALDSVLGVTRRHAQGDTTRGPEALGELARDRVVARLEPAFDDSAVARVARAFASLPRTSADSALGVQLRALEQFPRLAPADSSVLLARSSAGDVRAGEVVAAWARLSLAYRPRIDTPDQVRDLVGNLLFERVLRAAAARGHFERDPRVAAALTVDADRIRRRDYIQRHVLGRIVVDSMAVAAYWHAHADDWRLPLRVRGIRLVFDDRAAAVRIRVTLSDSAAAETLAARAARGGLDYRFEASARRDSALFRRALDAGPGAVVGPVREDGGWWVARVVEVLPERRRSWPEVRAESVGRWYAEEAERRTRKLAERLRASMRVETNPTATERLAGALRGVAGASRGLASP